MHRVSLGQVCLQALRFPLQLAFCYKPNVFSFPKRPDAQHPIHWISDFLSPGAKRSEREDDHLSRLVTRLRKIGSITLQENLNQSLDSSWGFQEFGAPRFQNIHHIKVVSLSALPIVHLYHPGNISGTHFCSGLSRPQSHSAAGRIMSMKSSNNTIGNRTRDLPARSLVPQPAVPPELHL